jgi:fructose-1-phosphate kinase PfkB-like protein
MILIFAPYPTLERVALVEKFQPGPGAQKPMRVGVYAGGTGMRAATVARLLDGDVLALGFVGGQLGALLREGLDRQDVPHLLTPTVNGTRGGFLLLDKEQGVISYVPEPAPEISESEANALLHSLNRHLPTASLLLIADDSQDLERDATLFARAIAQAKEQNIPVLADLGGSALTAALEAGVWLVRIELGALQRRTERSLQNDSAIITEALLLLEQGVGNVLITLGDEGALLITPEDKWRIKPPVVSHFNSTGSGETLMGALAVRYLQTHDLVEAVRYGCAAASVNVTYDEPGYATIGEVNILHRQTIAEPIIIRQ